MSALTDLEADVAWHQDYLQQMRRAYNAGEPFHGPVTAERHQLYGEAVESMERELKRMKKEQRSELQRMKEQPK